MHSARPELEARQQQSLKQYYSEKCTDIYAAIQRQILNKKMEEGWEMQVDGKHDIITWTFTDTSGHYPEYTGSDGRLVVKIFGENSYDDVKTEDFIMRGELLYDAVSEKLTEKYVSTVDRQEFKAWLKDQKENFKKAIQENAELDINILRNKELEPKAREKHFKSKFENAEKILCQAVADLAENLKNIAFANNSLSEASRKDLVEVIREAEKQYIADRGRPAIMKLGHIKEGDKAVMMVSAQFPQGERTLPSSIRDGHDHTRLSNHVIDCSGRLVGGSTIKFDLLVDGHSSYPPIEEENELKRRHLTFEALLEKINATARAVLRADSRLQATAENPLPISISSMMMLTPSLFDKAERAVRKSESENAQLADIHFAFEMLRLRGGKLILEGSDGKPIHIVVNLSYMNIPVNLEGMKYKVGGGGDLQDFINARGFHEHCMRIENALRQRAEQLTKLSPGVAEFMSKNRDEKDKLAQIAAADKILMDLYPQLNMVCQGLEQLEGLAAQSSLSYKDKQKQKADLLSTKSKIEQAITKDYQSIHTTQKKILNDQKDQLNETLDSELARLAPSPEKEFLMLLKRHVKMQDLFYNNKFSDSKNVYKFHVLYLLTNEEMGRHIEAFCKSAEDRTGWLRVSVLAHLAFYNVHGKDPDFSNKEERVRYDRYFSAAALELGVSRDNTAENSGAPGLQVAAALTNELANVALGKKVAGLAKKIYKKVDKLEVTNVFISRLKQDELAFTIHGEDVDHMHTTTTPAKNSADIQNLLASQASSSLTASQISALDNSHNKDAGQINKQTDFALMEEPKREKKKRPQQAANDQLLTSQSKANKVGGQ